MNGTPQIHLEGKVAIVTGASRGIGESIAKSFARHGAKVVLAARKVEGLARVVAEIEAEGGQALAVAAHTGHEAQIAELVSRAVAHFGQVDVLVNNAATNPYFGPMMNLDWGAWDKTFDVNVKGYFTATREVVKHLYSRKAPGAIVNVASVVGFMGAPLQGIDALNRVNHLDQLGEDSRLVAGTRANFQHLSQWTLAEQQLGHARNNIRLGNGLVETNWQRHVVIGTGG